MILRGSFDLWVLLGLHRHASQDPQTPQDCAGACAPRSARFQPPGKFLPPYTVLSMRILDGPTVVTCSACLLHPLTTPSAALMCCCQVLLHKLTLLRELHTTTRDFRLLMKEVTLYLG